MFAESFAALRGKIGIVDGKMQQRALRIVFICDYFRGKENRIFRTITV